MSESAGADAVRPSTSEEDELGFRLFAVLSGVAAWVLFAERGFHVVVHSWLVPMPNLVPLAFAFLLALRPSSVAAFLGYWATNTYHLLLGFPGNNTNQTLLFFLGLSILVAFAARALALGTFRLAGGELFRAFSPVLRLCVVGLYFWTIFHKLNLDFLNPEVSCARRLGIRFADAVGLGGFPDQMAVASVAGAVVIETALPVGLLFARTQRFVALLGLGFHFALGCAGYTGFSSTMMSALPLFLAPDAGQLFSGHTRRVKLPGLEPTASTLNRLAFSGWVGGLTFGKVVLGINPGWVNEGIWFGVPVFVAVLILWNRAPMRGGQRPLPVWQLLRRPVPTYVVPLLLFLNGACPFLGTKTEYSYAMYSNLRTEGGRTNHLFWKTPLALADYQTDLVELREGTDAELFERYGGRTLPRYELTTALHELSVSGRRGVAVVLSDGSGTRTVPDAERALAREPTYLERKFLSFRAIVPSVQGKCAH